MTSGTGGIVADSGGALEYAASMEERKHHNHVGGTDAPSAAGFTFEVPASSGEVLGDWPRSGDEDLDLALESALRVSDEWRTRSHMDRVATLHHGLEEIVKLRSLDEHFADRLGLPGEHCVRYRRQAYRRGDAVLHRAPSVVPARGVALVHVDARAAVSGMVEELFLPLSNGMPVLLLSDPAMPFIADEVCAALESAGLPPGVLGVLHDDGLTVLRAALARAEVTRAQVRGTPALIETAREVFDARPSGPGFADSPFGAGVPGGNNPVFDARRLVDHTYLVRVGSDPDGAAEEVVRRAFGAEETWSGQAEGAVGRVLCHERVFSRFSEALLGTLDELSDDQAGLPALDPELWEEVAERISLGLDEGATLIHGDPAGSRRPKRDAILTPSVFTNAEPRMRLARPGLPASVLVLMRCKDDAQAATLADELDGEFANID